MRDADLRRLPARVALASEGTGASAARGRIVFRQDARVSSGPLSLDVVEWHIRPRERSFQRCFENELMSADGSFNVRLEVSFDVLPDGHVDSPAISGQNVGDELRACLERTSLDLQFPETTGTSSVVSRLSFRTQLE